MLPWRLFLITASVVFTSSASIAAVVINEILYRPGTTFPENTGLEFIELHNTGATPEPIAGWKFTAGVDFTFPAGATIPAGGFVVVAGNPAAAQATYGITGVFGPWTGALSNSTENVRISQPGALPGTFDRVDEVTYATEGDWGSRVREATFGGWDWSTTAKTAGHSIEVINPALSNDNGQNWAASAAVRGTPGATNSRAAANIAPVIKAVKHLPAIPRSTETVKVSCELNDETTPPGLSATLFWRDATSPTPGLFSQLSMSGDGSGKFTATLPAMPNLTIVEWYIGATDGTLSRTWPAPTSEGQNANCHYQVDNETPTATDTYYRLVLTAAENVAFTNVDQNSDRIFHMTLVASRAGETTVKYRSGMRIRGNSSRGYQFKPLRIALPNDDLWDGIKDFNLHPKASHLQFLGMRLLQAAGLPGGDTLPIELRRNGVESTTSGGSTPDFGKWVRVAPEDGDYVNDNWAGTEADGDIFMKRSPERYWRSAGWNIPANPRTGSLDSWVKQNNEDASDWSALTNFFTVAQQTAASHFPTAPATDVSQSTGGRLSGTGAWNLTPLTAGELAQLETVADLDSWARWLAVMTFMQDLETSVSNGVDDDYGIYFVPSAGGQRRAQFVAHDLDTIFGLGDNQQPATYTDLYDITEDGQSDYAFRTLLPLIGTTANPGNATFRQKYHDQLRTLLGSLLNSDTAGNPNPAFHQFVDAHLTGWAPAGTITTIKTWATARQAHLLTLIGQPAIALPTATSNATAPASTVGTVIISEILADNVATHNEGGSFPDLIELHNPGGAAVDISDMQITDDPALPGKYTLPENTTIPAGGYLLLFADTLVQPLHTGFALNNDGETIQLRTSVANGGTIVDQVTFGPQVADRSIGRTGPAFTTWQLHAPTPGTVNTPLGPLGAPSAIRINEYAAARDYLISSDFVELYNPAANPAPVGGMALTDDLKNHPARYVFPPLSFIGAQSFLRLNARTGTSPTELGFGLDSTFGYIALAGSNGTVVDRADVIGMPRDTSLGRVPDGTGAFTRFAMPAPPTPGSANIAPPASVLALLNNLRVTEVLYRPNQLEFVELRNIGPDTLDLSGVQFVDGISYVFPAGTTLGESDFIVICKDRAAFTAQYGGSVPLAPGAFTGTLDNAGDRIALQPPVPWNVNILNFTYESGWFADPAANRSLQILSESTTAPRDWSEKESWQLSTAAFGNPGAPTPPAISSPLTYTIQLGQPVNYQITASRNPTTFGATGLPVGLSVNTSTGLITGTAQALGTTSVTISATAASTATATLQIVIVPGPQPNITSALTASGTVGIFFSYQIAATNSPTSYGATGLPSGLSINGTGRISGTPTAGGTTNVTISATNINGTDTETLVLTVVLPPAPQINSPLTADARIGHPFSYQITATNSPTSYSATGRPAWLAFDSATGILSGTTEDSAPFTVAIGATNPGGTDTETLLIRPFNRNSAPSFAPGTNLSLRQNEGPQTIANWATNFSPGTPNESSQTLTVTAQTSQSNLFLVQPALALDGTLTFTPHPARSGTAFVTITLRDNGGTAEGGVDTFAHQLSITTRAVNDAPTFTAPSTVVTGLRANYSQQWTTSLAAGPADEFGQTLSFTLTNNQPGLFTIQPSISPAGTLFFSAGVVSGVATLTVRLTDSGDTLDGGANQSPPFTLTVRVSSSADAAGTFLGLLVPDVAATHDNTGLMKVTITKNGTYTGQALFGGKKYSFRGTATDTGSMIFSTGSPSLALNRGKGIESWLLAMQLNFSNPFTVTGTLKTATNQPIARFTATRTAYDGKTAHVPLALLDPLTHKGKSAAALPALAAPNGGLAATAFPQGDGTGALAVTKTGTITLKGKLADGTGYTIASALLPGDAVPLHTALYGGKGSLTGTATFRPLAASDADGAALRWFRPAATKPPFLAGWPTGITVDFTAANIFPKATPLFPALGEPDGDGNTTVDLTDAAHGVKAINVDTKNRTVVLSAGADKLKITLSPATGTWKGTFQQTEALSGKLKTRKITGVLLRKANLGTGWYTDEAAGGRVQIAPAGQ